MSHDLKSLRDELRKLRKEKVKPVSRMKKADISAELEKLRVSREETAAPAAVPSAPLKKSKAAVETVKQAKATEFPVVPEGSGTKKGMERKTARKAYEDTPGEKKKSSKKDMMMALMKMMESDEE